MAANGSKLKKRSAANSWSRRLEHVVFFLDRSLGRKVIAAELRQAGLRVEVHDDHFAQDARDEEWLSAVGARGWVVLTKDQRIRYRTLEKTALLGSRVRAFVLVGKDLRADEMAAIFIRALPSMTGLLERTREPFIARITRGAQVQMMEVAR
jgi:predicted nuclease of predicted toxin-antitoxin system